ncbi:hypothetical protein KIPB_009014, partial [Kipferlia bialata]
AEKALTEGIGFDGSSVLGFARIEESDMVLKPDLSTYNTLPWQNRHQEARFICDVYQNGVPFEGDPRYILKKAVARAAALGYEFNTGPELEFFLFDIKNGKATTDLLDNGGYFDLAPTDLNENIRRDIVLALSDMDFDIEAAHHEVAPSQHEIDFKYADALSTADAVITFRFVAKTIALQHHKHCSFMAKPVGGINGSGMHVNCSLFKDGHNVFHDPSADLELSDVAQHFIAGVLEHVPAITRLANPTINSYKRLVPGYEAPVYIAWSTSNRTALVRVPAPRGQSTRIELRSPDPTANPYLAFAAILDAGMDGVESRLTPPPQLVGNIFSLTPSERRKAGVANLPGSLSEANTALLRSDLVCRTLGDHVVDHLTRLCDIDSDKYNTTVHQWEIERYLDKY